MSSGLFDWRKVINKLFDNTEYNKKSSKYDIVKIIVSNHLGEKILIQEENKQKRYDINLSNLSKGIYHIEITINNQIINQKIILQ